jgi:hypothetical protein
MFQLNIPVGTKEELLRPTERLYAILLWIWKAIPTESRWYPVFERYIKLMAGRVEGMGGNPSKIEPSGWGVVSAGPGYGEKGGGENGAMKTSPARWQGWSTITLVISRDSCSRSAAGCYGGSTVAS